MCWLLSIYEKAPSIHQIHALPSVVFKKMYLLSQMPKGTHFRLLSPCTWSTNESTYQSHLPLSWVNLQKFTPSRPWLKRNREHIGYQPLLLLTETQLPKLRSRAFLSRAYIQEHDYGRLKWESPLKVLYEHDWRISLTWPFVTSTV